MLEDILIKKTLIVMVIKHMIFWLLNGPFNCSGDLFLPLIIKKGLNILLRFSAPVEIQPHNYTELYSIW